jgi:ribosomal protein S18 acetylase RimI-like enzyme
MDIRLIEFADLRRDFFGLMAEVESGSSFDQQNPEHVEWLERKIARRIGSGGQFYGLYAPDGTPAGLYSLLIEPSLFGPGHAEVLDLGIVPTFRRQGHALSLLRDAEEKSIAAGACCLHLQTYAGDDGAVTLYRKAGFTPLAEMPGLNGPDERGQLLLHKNLQP